MKFALTKIALLLLSCVALHATANSYGTPERPQNLTPTDLTSEVTLTPTLTSSIFEVKDDSNNPIASAVHTGSEWLVYINNGVTLVGGSNLTGADRINNEAVIYNVSSATLNLSGSPVQYALITHERLELQDASNNLLGTVKLPSFLWQADNKDLYGAARLKIFSDTITVEWHYGNSNAATPWQLKAQGILKNNEIGVKFENSHFSSEFISAYGSNAISLCDESTCYDHSFSSIYNTGNTIVCGLANAGSDCFSASLYSGGVLDNLNIYAVLHDTSLDTNYTVDTPLMEVSEYSWVVRHSGTIDDTTVITGGWSNATSFRTKMTQTTFDINLVEMTLNNPPQEFSRHTSFTLDIANHNENNLASGLIIEANYYGYGNELSYPSECLITHPDSIHSKLSCTLDVPPNEIKQLEFSIDALKPADGLNFSFTAMYDGSYFANDSFETRVLDLNSLTDYSITTNIKDNYAAKELNGSPISISIENISEESGENTVAHIYWQGIADITKVGLDTSCSVIEASSTYTHIACVLYNTQPKRKYDIEVSLQNIEATTPTNNFQIEICEYIECQNGSQIYQKDIVIQGESKEGSGGSVLWLLSLLGLTLKRKF